VSCRPFELADGTRGIVCTRGHSHGGREVPCACGAPGERLCDYPVPGEWGGDTCSAPLCTRCATALEYEGTARDFCAAHGRSADWPALARAAGWPADEVERFDEGVRRQKGVWLYADRWVLALRTNTGALQRVQRGGYTREANLALAHLVPYVPPPALFAQTAPGAAGPDLLWVDVETTGLRPESHQVLQLAAIRTDHDARKVLGSFEARCLLLPGAVVSPEALKVNRIDPHSAAWRASARPLPEAIRAWWAWAQPAGWMLAGHGINFDRRFLTAHTHALGLSEVQLPAEELCTMRLARRLQKERRMPGVGASLGDLCRHFDINTEGAHTATRDVGNTVRVYRRLRDLVAAPAKQLALAMGEQR
jgi:DNA polymerase-3 subunit epsilon